MIKQLIKLANELDKKGLRKEADYLDSLLRKTAGRDESMEHEEHAQSLEAPEAEAAELQEGHEKAMADARKVAEWIVGGTPVFGEDADTDIDELTEMLSAEEHTATVKAILDFFSEKNELVLEKPPDVGAEKEAEYADPEDAFDPFKPEDLSGSKRERSTHQALNPGDVFGGSKRERSTHQTVDLGDLLES